MDSELWKDFPEELVEAVIARLPIPTLLRFRSVCQKWNALLKSPHFQKLWSSSAPQKQPLFYAVARVDPEIGALYDPSTKEWRYTQKVPPSSYWGLRSAASAGGLVCYYDHNEASFRVGNCLTQAWKKLRWHIWNEPNPRAQEIVVGNLGMVTLNQDYSQLSSGTGAYKIIGVDYRGHYQVYDSLKDGLISGGRIPGNINLPPWGFEKRTVSIDAVVYFLTSKPDGIISYDMVSGAWEQFIIPSPPNTFGSSIAECGGRLLLVAMVGHQSNSCSLSVYVWELETSMLCWKEVDRMPTSWSSEFRN